MHCHRNSAIVMTIGVILGMGISVYLILAPLQSKSTSGVVSNTANQAGTKNARPLEQEIEQRAKKELIQGLRKEPDSTLANAYSSNITTIPQTSSPSPERAAKCPEINEKLDELSHSFGTMLEEAKSARDRLAASLTGSDKNVAIYYLARTKSSQGFFLVEQQLLISTLERGVRLGCPQTTLDSLKKGNDVLMRFNQNLNTLIRNAELRISLMPE